MRKREAVLCLFTILSIFGVHNTAFGVDPLTSISIGNIRSDAIIYNVEKDGKKTYVIALTGIKNIIDNPKYPSTILNYYRYLHIGDKTNPGSGKGSKSVELYAFTGVVLSSDGTSIELPIYKYGNSFYLSEADQAKTSFWIDFNNKVVESLGSQAFVTPLVDLSIRTSLKDLGVNLSKVTMTFNDDYYPIMMHGVTLDSDTSGNRYWLKFKWDNKNAFTTGTLVYDKNYGLHNVEKEGKSCSVSGEYNGASDGINGYYYNHFKDQTNTTKITVTPQTEDNTIKVSYEILTGQTELNGRAITISQFIEEDDYYYGRIRQYMVNGRKSYYYKDANGNKVQGNDPVFNFDDGTYNTWNIKQAGYKISGTIKNLPSGFDINKPFFVSASLYYSDAIANNSDAYGFYCQ